jgi:hypothetical protein
MKKWISFDRIMLFLILVVLFFNLYVSIKFISIETEKFKIYDRCFIKEYQINDENGDSRGSFLSSGVLQKDQIIHLGDDVYEIEMIKSFFEKNCSRR